MPKRSCPNSLIRRPPAPGRADGHVRADRRPRRRGGHLAGPSWRRRIHPDRSAARVRRGCGTQARHRHVAAGSRRDQCDRGGHARPRRPGPLAHRGALRPGGHGRCVRGRAGGPIRSGPGAAGGIRSDHDRRRVGDAARPQGLHRHRPAAAGGPDRGAGHGRRADQRTRRCGRRIPVGSRAGAAGRIADARSRWVPRLSSSRCSRSPASQATWRASRSTGG